MNLPNKLTVFRIILVPIIILLFIFPLKSAINIQGVSLPIHQLVAVILFAIASFTDF